MKLSFARLVSRVSRFYNIHVRLDWTKRNRALRFLVVIVHYNSLATNRSLSYEFWFFHAITLMLDYIGATLDTSINPPKMLSLSEMEFSNGQERNFTW